MLSGEALHYAVLSNLLSFFLLLSEHLPQHNVLKHSKTIFFRRVKDEVPHCSNKRIYDLCLDSRLKDEILSREW
jgi:hypothetical protein